MIRFLTISIISSLMMIGLSAQEIYEMPIQLNYQGKQFNLDIGVRSDATNFYDKEIEDDLPPFQPPGGVFYPVLKVPNVDENGDTTEIIWSYSDYREIPKDDTITYVYKFEIESNIEEDIQVVVPANLPDQIISAVIKDRVEGVEIYENDILENREFTLENEHLTLYDIIVKYRFNSTNIVENETQKGVHFDNSKNALIFDIFKPDRILKVFDVKGVMKYNSDEASNEHIIPELISGVYFAIISEKNNIITFKFVKL